LEVRKTTELPHPREEQVVAAGALLLEERA
jgi:hypothetical protein